MARCAAIKPSGESGQDPLLEALSRAHQAKASEAEADQQ